MLEGGRNLAEALLGWEGRMISASKTRYRERHPGNAAIFNANVCVSDGKIWWGDLDLTLDEPLLRELAMRLGEVVYVLYERDGRFANEKRPPLDRALCKFNGVGVVRFDESALARGEDGALRWLTRGEREARRAAAGE
jgi:hypothetical protein